MIAVGALGTCSKCSEGIELVSVRGGVEWSDGHRSDPTVCFKALSLRHSPEVEPLP